MPVWKWLIFIIFIVLVCGLSLFLFCAIKIASKCTREEERRIKYKKIRWNNKNSKKKIKSYFKWFIKNIRYIWNRIMVTRKWEN